MTKAQESALLWLANDLELLGEKESYLCMSQLKIGQYNAVRALERKGLVEIRTIICSPCECSKQDRLLDGSNGYRPTEAGWKWFKEYWAKVESGNR